jgi:NAD(P)-dependent dehydrogenase (short-subunit alcohol dehydrogenase family)
MTTIFTPPDRKIAIVTGGARGIGAAIATRLAADGHDVAVFDLDADACAETVGRIDAARWRSPSTYRTRTRSSPGSRASPRTSGRPLSWSTMPASSAIGRWRR